MMFWQGFDVDINVLIMMIQQIEKNVPNHGDVAEKIAGHIESFWAPAMRTQLYNYVSTHRSEFGFEIQQAIDLLHAKAKA